MQFEVFIVKNVVHYVNEVIFNKLYFFLFKMGYYYVLFI